MGLPVTIKVNFRGNVKRFVAPDLDKSEWESVEAWIKASFGISHFQVKYFDEDNEEVSINSQEEYEEAVKSAEKQGNQLHMNVYKAKQGLTGAGPIKTQEVKELKGDRRPAPPYPSRVKTVDKGTQVTPERDAVVKDSKLTKPDDKPPPAWFRSYMEKFKDEVVKEVVERMCNDFSGQCCTHKVPDLDRPLEALGAVGGVNVKGPKISPFSTGPPAYTSLGYTPDCSKCKRPASDGAYQCSVCPSCILCELCRHSHDPSHNLVRTKTPLSIPEHGTSGESRFTRRGDRTVRKAERQRLKAERRQLKAEVKEIKKKLRLEKRGLQWVAPATTNARSNIAANMAPALASALAPAPTATQAPEAAPSPDPQASSPEGPEVSHTTLVPTMAALFLDENLPDGTRLEPDTKFIKYWKMRNSGTISWTSETKLKFMWGNLASEEKREVSVPALQPGQVGVVSVAFVAPVTEGTYTSHWRLAHRGGQFGPRVWCSIVVAHSRPTDCPQSQRPKELPRPVGVEKVEGTSSDTTSSRDSGLTTSVDLYHRDYFFPSVDLLTAQDLLSFELLDINIVQELEKVPHNTPVDLTPCMSPLPHEGPLMENPDCTEGNRVNLLGMRRENSDPPGHDEGDEGDISGTQFVCETVIRSLALEEAPDHKPLRRQSASCRSHALPAGAPGPVFGSERRGQDTAERVAEPGVLMTGLTRSHSSPPGLPQITLSEEQTVTEVLLDPEVENVCVALQAIKEEPHGSDGVKEKREQDQGVENDSDVIEEGGEDRREEVPGDWDEVSSQLSSASSSSSSSSCEDYVVVLPDCFDTSRPLGWSMYSPALSEPVATAAVGPEELSRAAPEGGGHEGVEAAASVTEAPLHPGVNQMPCASQTLDAVPTVCRPTTPSPYAHRSEAVDVAAQTSPCLSVPKEPCQPAVHLNVSTPTRPSDPASALETYSRSSSSLHPRDRGGITEGLVKGALSVAASAYKALFTGQSCSTHSGVDPARQDASMMAVLLEMGFRDRRLNQRLLRKNKRNLLHTVNELIAMADNEWGVATGN
ncbi:NBR1 autophagy cargo receptor a isoform X2 [Esox lucius]|uniref:NBR1 autophagy cargo receptor a isoform X2 n=1 Tax=Esox lucius TaxID=8010 RepID=UPI0014769BA1|nr:NBR1 autophagy cargo receptor a isoform X2 [Esox lucius]